MPDLQLRVVARDADLAGHVERNFLEAVLVGHFVDEGHQQVQPWRQCACVFAQTLLDPGILLWDDLDGARDEDHGDDEYGDGDSEFHGTASLEMG